MKYVFVYHIWDGYFDARLRTDGLMDAKLFSFWFYWCPSDKRTWWMVVKEMNFESCNSKLIEIAIKPRTQRTREREGAHQIKWNWTKITIFVQNSDLFTAFAVLSLGISNYSIALHICCAYIFDSMIVAGVYDLFLLLFGVFALRPFITA